MKHKVTIISSFLDPWVQWDIKITQLLESAGIAWEYLYVENCVIENVKYQESLYFTRTNSEQAKAICASLFLRGAILINGSATSYLWSRVNLLQCLQTYGVPIPIHYFGYNLSAIYNAIPESIFPILCKSPRDLSVEDPKLIQSKSQLLDWAAKWSVSNNQGKTPFFFEEYLPNMKLVKVYVIGSELFAFQRFESLAEKAVTIEPVPTRLNNEIRESLQLALNKCNLQVVSVDVLTDISNESRWYVIDVNLVPMFSYLENAPQLLVKLIKEML